MITVNKSQAPAEFSSFVESVKPTKWEQLHENDADGFIYDACMTTLRAEQSGLSAYTEEPLPARGTHIDHFRRRQLFQLLIFDWNNLFAEPHNPCYGADYKDLMMRSAKDYDNLVSPTESNCNHYFTYLLNGQILPQRDLSDADYAKAEFTIKAFGLNHAALVQRRVTILRMVKEYAQLEASTIRALMRNQGFPSVVDFALSKLV